MKNLLLQIRLDKPVIVAFSEIVLIFRTFHAKYADTQLQGKNMMSIHVMTSPPKAVKEAKSGQSSKDSW